MSENAYIKVTSPLLYPEKIEKKNGEVKVLDTYKNLEWLLTYFNAEVRYNSMTRRREIIIPNEYFFADDIENDSLARVEYIATVNGMPNKQIDRHLDVLAGENTYHPIIECIKDNPWDRIPRLDNFIETIESTNPDVDYAIIKTWMISAIAAAHSITGFTNHGVLVIQGHQGIGKTAWVKSLDPTDCGAVKVGVLLDPRSKDSVIGASRFWIIELGEFDATLNRTDIAHLKSFITSSVDDIRLPYGRRETRLIRRTAYVATVNEESFLVDTTGNRRWWTVIAKSINYQHGIDMKQVWSEVYQLWQDGALTYLPSDVQSIINDKNEQHEKVDPLKEKLLAAYDWSTTFRRRLTASAILGEIDYSKPTIAECTRMGKILTEINGKKSSKSNGMMVHEVPEKLLNGKYSQGI